MRPRQSRLGLAAAMLLGAFATRGAGAADLVPHPATPATVADVSSATPASSSDLIDAAANSTTVKGADAAAAGHALAENVERLVVTATRARRPRAATAAAISVVDERALRHGRATSGLDESLARVPGVLVQNAGNQAQDERLQIRGFGTRAAFGVREIKIVTDGLPETLPDGQTQLDHLDLGLIDNVEVMRGPGAALWGNAAGGVIHLTTRAPSAAAPFEATALGGSFGLARGAVLGSLQVGPTGGFLGSSFFRIDGYRGHSAARWTTATARVVHQLADDSTLRLLVDAVDAPLADDPGGLTRQQADADPRQAQARNVQFDAGETVQQVRLGLAADRAVGAHTLTGYMYGLWRDFANFLPVAPNQGFGVVQFQRWSPGGGATWAWTGELAGWRTDTTLGADGQFMRDDRQRYANDDGVQGVLGLDQIERVSAAGVFGRWALWPSDDVELAAALRGDITVFDVDVRYPTDGIGSGQRTMGAPSPAVSVLWNPDAATTLWANVGTAFQTPTTTELVNPNAPGLDPSIEPQRSLTGEIGSRLRLAHGIETGVAVFYTRLRDEIVPYQLESGQVAFRNAGLSRRYGLELDGLVPLPWALEWTGAAALIDAEYLDYTTAEGNFDGDDEPGIPPWTVYQELAWRPVEGPWLALEMQAVGRMWADDANDARSDSWILLGLRGGWPFAWGDRVVEPFFGLRNLADVSYDAVLRINATGGRFYEPGATLNAFAGVRVTL